MDSDFDFDDIADEDLILAASQLTDAQAPLTGRAANPNISSFTALHGQPRPEAAKRTIPPTAASKRSLSGNAGTFEVDDIPADAFDGFGRDGGGLSSRIRPSQKPPGQSQVFRQTTLFGTQVEDPPGLPEASRGRPYRGDGVDEPPTHHELNHDALKTWVYPTNLGPIRDYQFTIVKNGLFNNTLVALPTGLGKTFIAATVVLNFFRWTKKAKIIFVAPTKPLVSQQVDACLNVAGIPRSQTSLLTGETAPVLRESAWAEKRLFFMTPQTLMNDLSKGYADPKSIVLLIIDEAHRATGDYAYVKVIGFIRRFSKSFRVLALTATPGSTVEGVQDVIDNLGISHIEIRTEDSMDLRQYVHSRDIETVLLDPSDEIMRVREMFSRALKPLVDKLSSANIYYNRDPMSLTTFGLVKARAEWMNGPGRNINQGQKWAMISVFSILQSLAHSIKLLNFHGIKPFYDYLVEFRTTAEEKGENGGKQKRQLLGDKTFREMMIMIEKWLRTDGFVSHPKITDLCQRLLNHFMDAGEHSNTRAIVFSEYRASAEEIVKILNKQPMIRATVFVGQADSKKSQGMKQKQQIETIQKFKSGTFNVLVATSIGEEGLDIGQVDLIVCYDASASPIRMLQRMGRTGRKRAGNIVLLLMKGKEEEQFAKAKENYSAMQGLICEGSRFTFRYDLSSRIVPREIRPEVEKRHVDIPLENTQDSSLPEPKKTAAALRKKPAKKKFNMPDGVETGFVKASALGRPAKQLTTASRKEVVPVETDFLAENPELDRACLTEAEAMELKRLYKELPYRHPMRYETAPALNLNSYPSTQRRLRRTAKLKHGIVTKRVVRLLKTFERLQELDERLPEHYDEAIADDWESLSIMPFAEDTDGDEPSEDTTTATATSSSKKRRRTFDDAQSLDSPPQKRQTSAVTHSARRVPSDHQRPSVSVDGLDSEEGLGEDDDASVPESLSLPMPRRSGGKTGVGNRKAPRGKKGGTRNTIRRRGDHLEELGDDCTRTSDMDETDGSDSGGDLEDFIVGDNEITSSMRRSQRSASLTTCSSLPSPKLRAKTKHKASETYESEQAEVKLYFQPTEFPPTQETQDDDLPDLRDLPALGSKSRKNKANSASGRTGVGNGDNVVPRYAAQRNRPVVQDSDDDD